MLGSYLEHLDLVFSFEFLHAPWRAREMRDVIADAVPLERVAWVLSNHDFRRLVSRLGEEAARAAGLLLLTLPGATFIYQGDEIGMADGSDQGIDRAGRDRYRHPMQWDPSANAGFTSGRPWLEASDPSRRSVAAEHQEPDSLLSLYRRLIALRRDLDGEFALLDSPEDMLAFRRGEHVIAINFAAREADPPVRGEVVLTTHPGAPDQIRIPPNGGIVLQATEV